MDAPVTRCLYVDLDGTLLGSGGSLLHDGSGAASLEGARAVQTCLRAGVEVVLMSGRRRAEVAEVARLLGQSAYIFEGGACVVIDGEEHWLTGERTAIAQDHDGPTVAQQIEQEGAPALLLARYRGRLEYHEPWHGGREASHLFRGLLDTAEANRVLAEHGHGDVRLFNNGIIRRYPPELAALGSVHAYHLVPACVSKATAVAFHLRARAYAPADAIAVGDSRMDLECASQVGTFWLVANALTQDPELSGAIAGQANVHVTESTHGAGVYEAVVSTLVQDRFSGGR